MMDEASARMLSYLLPYPICPRCGSERGWLGTGLAYFFCEECDRYVYWTSDYEYPKNGAWDDAIRLSPWGRNK